MFNTYVSEVPIQYLDVAMDDLQCDKLIVLWVDSCDKEQTCVSNIFNNNKKRKCKP